ncbi:MULTISPECIES: PP0621 family protein [unclassified Pseudomonas]|uniref:PP0621 family protein n=1 Tax=unclassified Pseudomonas TaxID=196821 RepID=UPI002448537F|nr:MULTISPECIES: PP0621 family protein [unclassified Pseudomonas]MDH0896109.1 PP0621 family protein [Pseudomonas sp. GD03875]MDH1064796.1 PP0621 family protein [Pseudomonas sp. GD03985]
MFRLLFWIALIAAAVWLWRRFKRPARPAARPREEQASPMVRCARCGVHVPREKALPQGENWYCSQAHLPQEQSGQ